jgi:serine/threonine-protein kinase
MAAVIAAVLALGTVLGAIAWQQRQARPPVPVFAFQVDPGEGSVITTSAYAFSISPDGSAIAYTQSSGGPRLLAIRQLASTAAVDLVGTDDAWAPFWSPDSGSIAFFAAGKLKRFDVATRSVQTIADVPRQALGIGSWGSAATDGAPLVSLCMSSVPPACRLQRRCHARQSKARPRRVPVIRAQSGAHDRRISTRDQLG